MIPNGNDCLRRSANGQVRIGAAAGGKAWLCLACLDPLHVGVAPWLGGPLVGGLRLRRLHGRQVHCWNYGRIHHKFCVPCFGLWDDAQYVWPTPATTHGQTGKLLSQRHRRPRPRPCMTDSSREAARLPHQATVGNRESPIYLSVKPRLKLNLGVSLRVECHGRHGCHLDVCRASSALGREARLAR